MKTFNITIIALLSITLLSSSVAYADSHEEDMRMNGPIQNSTGSVTDDMMEEWPIVIQLRAMIAELEAKIAELQEDKQKKNAKIAELQEDKQKKNAKIAELRDKLKAKTSQTENQDVKLQDKLDRKNAKNAELEDALDNKDAKIDHLKEKVDRKIDNKNEKLDAMKAQMSEMKTLMEKHRIIEPEKYTVPTNPMTQPEPITIRPSLMDYMPQPPYESYYEQPELQQSPCPFKVSTHAGGFSIRHEHEYWGFSITNDYNRDGKCDIWYLDHRVYTNSSRVYTVMTETISTFKGDDTKYSMIKYKYYSYHDDGTIIMEVYYNQNGTAYSAEKKVNHGYYMHYDCSDRNNGNNIRYSLSDDNVWYYSGYSNCEEVRYHPNGNVSYHAYKNEDGQNVRMGYHPDGTVKSSRIS